MKPWHIGLALILAVSVLAGCRGGEPTPAPVDADLGDTYTSEVLDASYPDALDASSQLMLGTLKLEGTERAVTAEQAEALLPLWQALQGGVLQASAERNAVVAQIEAQMTSTQLEAIAAMRLTPEDFRTWAEDQGLDMGFGGGQEVSPDARATRQAQFTGGQEIPPEMATRRAQFEGMSEEERAASRATVQTGGGPARPPGGAGAGSRRPLFPLRPLIELLEARAAEDE